MPVKDLIKVPIWQGNRLLCEEHKKQIQESLKGSVRSLDLKPYHIVTYPEDPQVEDAEYAAPIELKSFIIDGQHRISILKEAFYLNPEQENFDCIVIEKQCTTFTEAVEYFKVLNTTRAVEWRHDPNLIANTFIGAMVREFNTPKLVRIRNTAAKRPYMSIEKLREAIRRQNLEGKSVEEFITNVRALNAKDLDHLKASPQRSAMEQKAVEIGFCLALDPKFKWLGLV